MVCCCIVYYKVDGGVKGRESGYGVMYPFVVNDEYVDVFMGTGLFEECGYSAILSHRPANVTVG